VTPRSWRPCSLYGAPLRQFLYGAPLRQFLYGAPLRQLLYGSSSTAAPLRQLLYGSFSAAATGLRPLTPSWSFCDVKPLHSRQLACASAGVQLLSAALIAVTRPLLPSHGPYCHHTALIAVMRPLPPSWSFCDVKPLQPRQLACASAGVQLLPAAPAALMRPLPPSCGPCRPHAAPAALMRPLLPSCGTCRRHGASATLSLAVRRLHSSSCGPCHPHAAPAALMRPLLPSCSPCQLKLTKPGSPPVSYRSSTSSSAASAPAPWLSTPWPSLGGPL
jgi:hypothetical protein